MLEEPTGQATPVKGETKYASELHVYFAFSSFCKRIL